MVSFSFSAHLTYTSFIYYYACYARTLCISVRWFLTSTLYLQLYKYMYNILIIHGYVHYGYDYGGQENVYLLLIII